MAAMKISELARRSGVPVSTLRYYGKVGLLPADRNPSGYRVYDDHAEQRLMFIGAAKRLRLSLPVIADLLSVWESDPCRTIKAQLRPLLRERLSEADAAIADLHLLRDHLAQAQRHLDELPDRDDRCDPECTFLLEGRHRPGRTLPLLDQPSSSAGCTLDDVAFPSRVDAWHHMLADASVTTVSHGISVSIPADRATALTELIVAEQSCCGFLHFTLTFGSSAVVVTVTGSDHAQSLIAELAGGATQELHT